MVIYTGINFEVVILSQNEIFLDFVHDRDMPLGHQNSVQAVQVFQSPISRTASGIDRKEDTVENENFEVYC